MKDLKFAQLVKEAFSDLVQAPESFNAREEKYGKCPPPARFVEVAVSGGRWDLSEKQHIGQPCPYCMRTMGLQWELECPADSTLEESMEAGFVFKHALEPHLAHCQPCQSRLHQIAAALKPAALEVAGAAAAARRKVLGSVYGGEPVGRESKVEPLRIPAVLARKGRQEQKVVLEILEAPQYRSLTKRVVVTLGVHEIPDDILSVQVWAVVPGRPPIPSFEKMATLTRDEPCSFEFEIPEEVRSKWFKAPEFVLTPAGRAPRIVDGHVGPRLSDLTVLGLTAAGVEP